MVFVPLILLLIAPVIGSFLGVLVLRSGDGRSAVLGRSHCEACHHALDWRDLFPLLSWLMLGRRCRYCGAALSAFYPGIELASFMPVLWAASVMAGWSLVLSAVLGWMLLALGLIDWCTRRLPNFLTFALLATGLVATLLFDRPAFADHLIGAAVGYAVFAIIAWLYRKARGFDGLGGGDARLLAALGAWVSWQGLPIVILLAALLCLGYVGGRAIWRGRIATTERVPFGPFLALAGWIVWLYGPFIAALIAG
ncbi:MAG TPA: A24 family peptidase [Rhizomicrobium sp.]